MKKVIALSAVLFGICTVLFASPPDGNWFTDANAAMAEAKAKQLPVFAYFTGSDWCPYCKIFSEKVLQTQRFRDFATGKVVLLYLDFPQEQQLPESLVRQNEEWQARYRVEGFPTVLLVDADGNEIDRLGYTPQGDFIATLKAALNPAKEADYIPAAGWMNNFDKALALATEKKLPVVLVFTGSDWSSEDKTFKSDVLESKALHEFAAGKAVLVCVDFPRSVLLPRPILRQNSELLEKYQPADLPATLILNAAGEKIGGFEGGGDLAAYLRQLKTALDSK